MLFDDYPSYYRYRTLYQTNPAMQGEDVFALQISLNKLGHNCGPADGIFGSKTTAGVKQFQTEQILVVDGKAGGITQQEIAMELASDVAAQFDIPLTAFKGQLALESGFRLGNYSPLRPDLTYDAGVCQRNTKFTPAAGGFDPGLSIHALGDVIHRHYLLFEGVKIRRRWALAQGAWNAPAFACYIARDEGAKKVASNMVLRPSTQQNQTFEQYVAAASAYLLV